MNSSVSSGVLLVAFVAMSGCMSSTNVVEDDLKFFGMMYFNTQQVLQKPPSDWEQVLHLVDTPDLKADHDRLTRIKEAQYTIDWGVDAKAVGAKSTVLCYADASLSNGGPVLFADGSVIEMSGTELTRKLQESR